MLQKRKYNKVSQTELCPKSSNIALNDTKMYHLETKATNYMNDSVIQKQSGYAKKCQAARERSRPLRVLSVLHLNEIAMYPR